MSNGGQRQPLFRWGLGDCEIQGERRAGFAEKRKPYRVIDGLGGRYFPALRTLSIAPFTCCEGASIHRLCHRNSGCRLIVAAGFSERRTQDSKEGRSTTLRQHPSISALALETGRGSFWGTAHVDTDNGPQAAAGQMTTLAVRICSP